MLHGALKLNLIQVSPWDILKNTGDTVRITIYDSVLLDQMYYGSLSTNDKGKCLVRNQFDYGNWVLSTDSIKDYLLEESSSPGYEVKQDSVFSWSISSKVIDISNAAEHFVISIASPIHMNYSVKIFDLSGYEVAKLCDKCSGRKSLAWYGKNRSGQTLPLGPYILWIKPGSGSPKKKALILAKPL